MAVARQLAELHAHMHTCVVPTGSYTQHQQIERGIEMSEALADEVKAAIVSILAKLPEGQAVCHGDFHPDNILLTSHGPVIIDWMNGTRGHPLGDVARTSLLFQTGGLPPRIPYHMRVIINATRTLLHTIYLDRYLHLHQATRQQINAWKLPLLAARLFEVENYPQEKRIILRSIETILNSK